jgi:hypothetical protein
MSRTAVLVRDSDGKDHIIVTSSITGVDFDPGKPAVPEQPAVEAKEANPGRPANGADPGEPPTAAVEAKEAVPADPGVPPTATINYGGGSAKVHATAAQVLEILNATG